MTDGFTETEKDRVEYMTQLSDDPCTQVEFPNDHEPVYKHELAALIAQTVEQTLAKMREQGHAIPEEAAEEKLLALLRESFSTSEQIRAAYTKIVGAIAGPHSMRVRDVSVTIAETYMSAYCYIDKQYISLNTYARDAQTLLDDMRKAFAIGLARADAIASEATSKEQNDTDDIPF